MPVITRSKARLLSALSAAHAAKATISVTPSKTTKQTSKPTNSLADGQPFTSQESPSHALPNRAQAAQDRIEQEQLPITETSSSLSPPPSSDIIKVPWPCSKCSCHKGAFGGLINSCIECGHSMDDHDIPLSWSSYDWSHGCDYICERQELVASTLQHVRDLGVVVVRATPMVGKSVLLKLLGHHIINHEPDLEPVYFQWRDRRSREILPYNKYLEQEKTNSEESNAKYRPLNPAARTVFLIDEAQGSYEEEDMWLELKNHHNTRGNRLFVLVCVYGAAGVSYKRYPNIESQAQAMHTLHRIELRPSRPGNPCMLFSQDEVKKLVQKFATINNKQLHDGVAEYIYKATHGHPGMVGLLITFLDQIRKRNVVQMPQTLSKEFLHYLIVQQEESFMDWFGRCGRGIWSIWCESYVEDCLHAPDYCHLKLSDIKKALRDVAMVPEGLTRLRRDFDAFAFCHKFGLLHTEQPIVGREQEIKFTFASPIHRRIAYRRLFPGREPDAVLENLTLSQICTNAIARFSPGALQNRLHSQSDGSWGIPEAAFQDELYCSLNLELYYLPVLTEYSHTKDGRMDFYISDRRWGIEVLQCGSKAAITEHVARFTIGGKYRRWDILDDYIILNFCPRSALQDVDVDVEDQNILSHFFHVVIEPEDFIAEIYTHDKQLHKFWSLSEGRQRKNAEDFYNIATATTSDGMSMEVETVQREQSLEEEVEKMRRQLEREKEMRLRMERDMEDMRLQMEREKVKMRLLMEQEVDQEIWGQEQDQQGKRKRQSEKEE